MAGSAAPSTVVAQIVETMRALAGPHPGFRPVHAKGVVCSGVFRGVPDARRMSRAPHLQGQPIPVVVRFAHGSGNPDVHDGTPGVRSLAVKFQLPDGASTDILANSIEGFVASTPEDLLEFLRAQLPDPATGKPAPDAVPRYMATRPNARGFAERLMQKPVPASYATTAYHAEHAFRFVGADGTRRAGRYHFRPEAGEAHLAPDEASRRAPSFLRDELESRLRTRPVVFRLELQLAGEKDPTHDATLLWPADRPRVELGRLEVTAISPTSAADERRLIFDPVNLADGIELSDDPLPRARSDAYSISYTERSKPA